MSLALLMIGDGRDEYHDRAYDSLVENVSLDAFTQVIKVDDRDHKLGFAGAIQQGWDQVDADYVFHLEMDFTFNWPIDLEPVIKTLDEFRYLTQIVFLRQPVNPQEIEAGGIIQQHPASYEQVSLPDGRAWIEHSRFFTMNPSVYPSWIAKRGWPQRVESEGHFGLELFEEDHARRSAFWGRGEQWVFHLGEHRTGRGY